MHINTHVFKKFQSKERNGQRNTVDWDLIVMHTWNGTLYSYGIEIKFFRFEASDMNKTNLKVQ